MTNNLLCPISLLKSGYMLSYIFTFTTIFAFLRTFMYFIISLLKGNIYKMISYSHLNTLCHVPYITSKLVSWFNNTQVGYFEEIGFVLPAACQGEKNPFCIQIYRNCQKWKHFHLSIWTAGRHQHSNFPWYLPIWKSTRYASEDARVKLIWQNTMFICDIISNLYEMAWILH